MRRLRITLAILFLAAAILFLTAGTFLLPITQLSKASQIIPSAINACLGTTVFWIVVTLLFGKVYCATVCPLGTLQDAVVWIRRKSNPRFTFRYQKPDHWRWRILFIYIISLLIGATVVGFVLEPWNILSSAASVANPADSINTWQSVGISAMVGVIAGGLVLIGVMIWAWKSGRAFCSEICPIGSALGCVHSQTLMHIAIDPDKCISCMKCEDVCSSRCIKVSERLVDNSRCVRCFDCLDVCPNDAIRYQINKDRHRQTPLMQQNS